MLAAEVESPEQLEQIGIRLINIVSAAVDVGYSRVNVQASVGAYQVQPGDDVKEMLHNADLALWEAKARGKKQCVVFTAEMGAQADRKHVLRADLAEAWERGEMRMLYQPIVRLRADEVVGVEALARWTHPRFGPISPAEFIPLAEESGTIVALGRWVVRQSVTDAAAWQRHAPDLYVSVNVSPLQLRDPAFGEDVEALLHESGVKRGTVVLELTETAVMSDTNGAVDVMLALRKSGIKWAIDDFGTGYSSLAYLQHLPVDRVKVDRSFVTGARNNARRANVVRAIIGLARMMKLDVVAEGIESVEDARQLRELGCVYGQGFLYSEALSPSEVVHAAQYGLVSKPSELSDSFGAAEGEFIGFAQVAQLLQRELAGSD